MKTLLKVSKANVDEYEGIVYVLAIRLEDGTEVIKVGVTKRDIQDRVCEILTSYWTQYRIYPQCKPKRYRRTNNIYEKEAAIHKELAEYRWVPEKPFSGSTEFFTGVELAKVVEIYERVLQG